MLEPKILPIATIQPTFLDVVREVSSGLIPFEDIWLSCYKTGQPSIHAKAQVVLDEVDRNKVNVEGREGDIMVSSSDGVYYLTAPDLGIDAVRIYTPTQEYKDSEKSNPQRPDRISAFDVSPDGAQYATGFLDGSIHVYPASSSTSPSITQPKNTKQISRAHKSTITSLQFFPSSRVLLSASSDFSLCIFPTEPLESPDPRNPSIRINPARTLKGHTRGVTSGAMLGRGKTVLSGARDGTVKLWDVSKGEETASFSALAAITRLVIPTADEDESTAYTAHTDGSVGRVDQREKDKGALDVLYKDAGEIVSLASDASRGLLAAGTSRGVVRVFDVRSFGQPVASWKRNDASVEDLAFAHTGGLVVAAEDGLAYVADVAGAVVRGEIVGGDCDAVRVAKIRDGKTLWTAGDDAVVRKYSL